MVAESRSFEHSKVLLWPAVCFVSTSEYAPANDSYAHTHRPLSSSFLGLPYRILNINP